MPYLHPEEEEGNHNNSNRRDCLSETTNQSCISTTLMTPLPSSNRNPHPTLVSKLLIPHLPIIYLLPLPLHHRPLLTAFLLRLLPPLPVLTLSGFFNGMLEAFEPGARNYFTFFRPILLTLSAFRNPILTHLPLSGFLGSLLCALIGPTPGLAFFPPILRTLAAALSFLSGRAYPFLNFLLPLFLRLILTLIMQGSTSL